MARVKFIRDEEPNILALSSNKKVIDGALYVATDTGSMWLGVAENRLLQINAANLDKDTTYTIHKSGNTIFFQDSNGTVTKITDDNTTYDDATDTTAGLMSAADKKKLDSIQEGASRYELPIASSTTLGGVKAGTNVTITEDGTLSADEQMTIIDYKDIDESTFYDVVKEKWPQIIVRRDYFVLWPQAHAIDSVDSEPRDIDSGGIDTYVFSSLILNGSELLGDTTSGYVNGLLVMKGAISWLRTELLSHEQFTWNFLKNKPFATIGSGLKVVSNSLSVDASALPSGLTVISIGETDQAADVYAKVQAAWPNCVLSGDAFYYPYAELPAVGSQAHAYLFTANGGGATSAWIVNATSMTHKSDIIATVNTTWGDIEHP